MDVKHKTLLDSRFHDDQLRKLESKNDGYNSFTNFDSFKRKILETSFIYAIGQDFPEVGQFLHLPEMDPSLVRDYDTQIVKTCMRTYMDEILGSLNMPLVNKMLGEYSSLIGQETTQSIKQELKKLMEYVLGILGIPVDEDIRRTEREWQTLQKEYQDARRQVRDEISNPSLVG